MPNSPNTNAPRSSVARSRVTNGKRAVLFGDGRSTGARRYRDVLEALAAELGGMATLPETARQTLRRAAASCVECELLESRRADGEALDPVAVATLANSNSRLLAKVQALKRTVAPKPQKRLSEHLAQRYGATAGATA